MKGARTKDPSIKPLKEHFAGEVARPITIADDDILMAFDSVGDLDHA